MHPHRIAGILADVGALVGLAGTAPLYRFLPSLVGASAFGLVLLLGPLTLRKRTVSRSLATAGIWFALLGGVAGIWIIWVAPSLSASFDLVVALGSMGVVGMCVSVVGGAMRRLPETEFASGAFLDRNRLGALLVCAGAAVGLIGSRVAFFGLFALLKLFCFALVLLFGVLLLRQRSEGRLLAAATLYFALLGGGVDLVFLPYGWILSLGTAPHWIVFTGPIAMVIAAAGAVIRFVRTPIR